MRDSGAPARSVERACTLIVLASLWFSLCSAATAQNPTAKGSTGGEARVQATHVLGFSGAPPNTAGALTVQDESLRFESRKNMVTLVRIDSIEDIGLSSQDKQVGGVPMTLGKAAAPFGGGRVVSLFSHKKYDDVTLIYRDNDGGVHGAIFQLQPGQGSNLQQLLIGKGARVLNLEKSSGAQSVSESENATR